MKDYKPGRLGVAFIFSLEGSVFPKAMVCALPNAIIAVFLWYMLRRYMPEDAAEAATSGFTFLQSWSAYNWVCGFLVSFRAHRAYSRWWEGGTLLQQARGEWFNAYSSLIAFCSREDEKIEGVQQFQQIVCRLFSMLYASALMSIATENDLDFEIIDATGLSERHLDYLRTQPDKCEIIVQWIQRLIVNNMEIAVLPIPAPVISRVFQELSRGIVNIHNVRKITEFQFPFPAAQMIVTMLVVQWFLTPVMAALTMDTPVWVFFVAFFPTFAFWGINYVATEIEQPFGTDFNDMPLHAMQISLNSSIMALLDEDAQSPPDFNPQLRDSSSFCFERRGMSSVRYVTIQDPDQLHRVKHQYTSGASSTCTEYTSPQTFDSWVRSSYSKKSVASSIQGSISEITVDLSNCTEVIPGEQSCYRSSGREEIEVPLSAPSSKSFVSIPEHIPARDEHSEWVSERSGDIMRLSSSTQIACVSASPVAAVENLSRTPERQHSPRFSNPICVVQHIHPSHTHPLSL